MRVYQLHTCEYSSPAQAIEYTTDAPLVPSVATTEYNGATTGASLNAATGARAAATAVPVAFESRAAAPSVTTGAAVQYIRDAFGAAFGAGTSVTGAATDAVE